MAIRARAPTQQRTLIKLLLLSHASPWDSHFGLVKVGVEKFSRRYLDGALSRSSFSSSDMALLRRHVGWLHVHANLLARLDHVASFIVNANHGIV
jgi:hypothetical protein